MDLEEMEVKSVSLFYIANYLLRFCENFWFMLNNQMKRLPKAAEIAL